MAERITQLAETWRRKEGGTAPWEAALLSCREKSRD